MLDGLVDSGADPILASDLLAEQLGIDLEDNEGETSHGVGGKYHKARVVVLEPCLSAPRSHLRRSRSRFDHSMGI